MRRRELAVLGIVALVTTTGCGKITKRYLARARAASSADAGPAVQVAASAAVPVPLVPVAVAPPSPPKERRELVLLRGNVATLRQIVARGRSSESADAEAKCDELEAPRKALRDETTPEVADLLAEASRVCGFDVPILATREALAQLDRPGSQASVMLSCRVASKQLEKARAAKPGDPALRTEDARYKQLCAK